MKNTPPSKDLLIMGLHCVREVLLHASYRLVRVFAVKHSQEASRKSEMIELCQKNNIPISFCSFEALTALVGSDSHQSVVAQIKQRTFHDLGSFLVSQATCERSLVLMLDQIFDPQNFGALLRSAECFGVSGVVWSKNRGVDITPVVSKTSCGASELVPLIRVANLAETVTQFRKNGFEAVASLLAPEAENLYHFDFAPKTLLVVGSEGEGIQPLIQKRCERAISIPMVGNIGSLNVAQAAAVLLSYASKK